MIPTDLAPLTGHSAIITASPFTRQHNTPDPLFVSGPELGDDVILLEERADALGNVAVWCERTPSRTWRLCVDCLTLTLGPRPANLPERAHITRDIAAHVLYAFTGTGYPAGSFFRALIDAAVRADPGNLAQIARGFPGYAAAVRLATNDPRGIDTLKAILRDDKAAQARLHPIGDNR